MTESCAEPAERLRLEGRQVVRQAKPLAERLTIRQRSQDRQAECLLEIPHWHMGWQQPFWFKQPKRLDPGDELYIECHFDNSQENQPNGRAPRDIGWGGENQDMCAAFMSFTDGAP